MSLKNSTALYLSIILVFLSFTKSFSQAEIRVEGNGYNITDGTNTWPDSTGQAFGVLHANNDSLSKVFWIFNDGTSDLTLNNFTITAAYTAHFNITDPSNLVVPAGDSIFFSVQYKPTARGTHGRTTGGSGRANIQFTSNDADEATYNFNISGVATPADAFDCSSGRMIFSANSPTDLFDWNYADQPPTLTTIRDNWPNSHDGMAMNPNDNFIYAMRYNAGNRNQLWAFDQSGEESFVGYVSGGLVATGMNPHFPAGAFDTNDNLYVFQNADNTTGFHKINVKSQQAEQIILSSAVYLRDVIFNPTDGLLYGMSAGPTNDGLVSIDPTTGNVTLIGGDGDVTHAAMFRSTDGTVFMMTQTYTMYQVDLTNGNLTQVAANPGWGNGVWVDGCACGEIALDADLAISKTDNRPSYVPGSLQNYKISVTNSGPHGVYQAAVRDLVPTGITSANVSWYSTTYGTATSRFTSGTGALNDTIDIGVGDSIVYTVRIVVDNGFTGDLTNTATVTAPSFITDTDLSNNTSTDIDVPVASAAEQCNNGFDDDGDGLVDCFDGDCAGNSVCSSHYTNGIHAECPDTPDVSLFSMQEQYSTANNVGYGYATPVVGDLDSDGIPEIVTINNTSRRIYVANGQTGATITSITYQQTYHHFAGGVSIADIDNDGTGEVFIVTGNAAAGFDNNNSRQYISCYDYDGGVLTFRYRMSFGQNNRSEYDGQKYAVPQFVDFDQDGTTEMFIGNHVMNAATGAVIASPTIANRYLWPRGRYGAAVGFDDYMSAAYDILPDGFCATCDGVEIIAGNTVYAVDLSDPTNTQNGITVAAQMTPTGTYRDGLTSLADWDGDGEMDVIVVGGNGGGAYVYVWNPRTQTIIQGATDIQAGNGRGGRATVADFDGDGTNELAIVSTNRLHVFEPNLSVKWSKTVVDGSSSTSATAFDFEGDGNMEVVYRDEQNLYIIDGTTGATKVSLPCASGTRVEMPVIADVDADGEAEIICSCDNYGGGNRTVVFTSNQTPWMPSRKVWNSLHYAPTFINDDLTIPAVRQHKSTIPKLDIYAAQAPITDPSGNLIFPALPDFVVTIDSATIGSCNDDSTAVHVTICNDDSPALRYDYPLSFYDGDPNSGGTLLGTRTVTIANTTFTRDSCYSFSFNTKNTPTNLYVLVNDDGTGNFGYPTTSIQECDSTNNQANDNVGCAIDAGITKDDGQLSYIPGGPVTYTITARNLGPNFTGGVVSDPLPSGISAGDVTWTATTYGGATTKAIGTMNGALQDTVDITGSDSIVYSVTIATPETLVGDLVNTVTITVTGDTTLNNNTATDTDTVDCSFAISGSVNSRTAGWSEIGTVRSGNSYNFSTSSGFKTFTATNGPENGQVINSVIFNTGTNQHVSLTKNKYTPANNWLATVGTYDNTPHGWTGLSGTAPENAPILGFIAFVDQNGNGTFDSGTEEYIRDITTLAITPTTTGQLYMAFYDDGPYNDNSGIMTINASVSAAAVGLGNDTTLCEGNAVTLDAGNSGVTYLWNTTATTQTIQGTSTGQYSVAVNTGGGCLVRDTINIIVDTINVSLGSDTSLCIGDSLQLDAGNPGDTYSWSTGETSQTIQAKTIGEHFVAVTGASGCIGRDTIVVSQIPLLNLGFGNDTTICVGESINFTFTKPIGSSQIWNTGSTAQTITTDSAGAYSVLVTDSNGCPNHDTIVLSLNPLPIVVLGNDSTICPDSSLTITSPVGTSWTWSTGDNTQSISTDTAGVYDVIVTDANGCINYDTIEVSVASGANINLGNDTSICAGDTLFLDAGNAITWTWNSLQNTQNIAVTTAGTYIVDVTYASGCAFSDTIVVNIDALPIVALGNDTSICELTSHILDAGSATSWIWNTIDNSQTITVDTIGNYNVAITDANGCIGRDSIAIGLATVPLINLGSDTTVCQDSSVTITSIDGTIWDWSTGENTQAITVNTTGKYDVEVTNAAGCISKDTVEVFIASSTGINLGNDTSICAGDTLFLDAGNGITWTWSSLQNTQNIVVTTAGIYIVDVTYASGCTFSDTIVVNIDALPIVALGNDTSICEFSGLTLDAQVGMEWLWNTGATTQSISATIAQDYSVIATDVNDCKNYDTLKLTLINSPQVDLGNDTTICDQSSITYTLVNGTSWLWSDNTTANSLSTTGPDTIRVIASNGICSTYDTVIVGTSPLPIVDLGIDTTICEGTSYVLDAQNNGSSYLWQDNSSSQTLIVNTQATYFVDVTNTSNCFGSDTIGISVSPSPSVPVIDPQLTAICDLVTDSIELEVLNDEGMTIGWSTGDSTVTIVADEKGMYIVTKTNSFACSASDTSQVVSECDTVKMTIPNIFTPNNDGTNDALVPIENPVDVLTYVTQIEFIVYNRWGRAMFTSVDILPNWNGRFLENNMECPAGVYFWVINYTNVQEQSFSINGFVQLIR